MTQKEQIVKIIEKLSDDVTVSEVIAELYFKQQVDTGLKELDEGKGVSYMLVKEQLGSGTLPTPK